MAPEDLPDPIAVALTVASILESLEVRYLVAGSIASSLHGELRSTNDVGPAFYVSEEAVRDALKLDGSFNAIHLATAVKVDVFVAGRDPFDAERLAHRMPVHVRPDRAGELFVDTAEHTVLRKLEWYRRGGEASDRQWRDVVGVLSVRRGGLDEARLDLWAERLGVADLLERARRDAGSR